ncbi:MULTISPECIES: putative hemolysin [Tenebrionibacter/Tenebrionicola group]|jgi:putative hemolysin|uniref:DUF333 domain-containing protein n=2 Tax=Tenebrionibacter/Tenebrionicola group TaxID=2969848 RepID=A0A8K0V049_9ENTR|nr:MULTISPECIES: DUF333 domain-containing protein [Tenebrionibacter/Tenebrionicola group]MBK4714202.1 DUF333 domain-containing protein [Tenebrionibacter intestinalis]MBV4413355.1 DUF333 domain-containing protein [Tenebrionicola larvae]MBV5094239.1 DUF333 domain-containing protein [Tenebrionicola larvae]
MKHYAIALAGLLVSGCAQHERSAPPAPRIGMPNPASVWCKQKGGTLVPVQTPRGVIANCKLPSGEVVEEWTLWRRDHPQSGKGS